MTWGIIDCRRQNPAQQQQQQQQQQALGIPCERPDYGSSDSLSRGYCGPPTPRVPTDAGSSLEHDERSLAEPENQAHASKRPRMLAHEHTQTHATSSNAQHEHREVLVGGFDPEPPEAGGFEPEHGGAAASGSPGLGGPGAVHRGKVGHFGSSVPEQRRPVGGFGSLDPSMPTTTTEAAHSPDDLGDHRLQEAKSCPATAAAAAATSLGDSLRATRLWLL
mmetsp:Transcript_51936/g.110372  ORF Transcript_51936/g.110372 Transcript_51936/m.110372 type:complete len:220 (+) Transcript_51936:437-1096(+)